MILFDHEKLANGKAQRLVFHNRPGRGRRTRNRFDGPSISYVLIAGVHGFMSFR